MAGCCGHDAKFDGVSDDYKKRLWIVIAINAVMFGVEMVAGQLAGSQALQADALDFLGDSLTYGISLAVIGASIRVRTNAALAKGISLMLMGAWVFGSTLYRVFYIGVPEAEIMGIIGFMALAANLRARKLPGVTFVPVRFTPDASRHKHVACGGVHVLVTLRT